MFVTLRGEVDFSYFWIILFWAYASSLINIHWGLDMMSSILVAFVFSLVCTCIVLYLSDRLKGLYFAIWTLALYLLILQLTRNMEGITNGVFWLTGMERTVWPITLVWLEQFMIWVWVVVVLLIVGMKYFTKTFLFQTLKAWWERDIVIRSLWVNVTMYKAVLIFLTTFLAVLWWWLFASYYQYIDPYSFWITLLILVLALIFGSFSLWEIGTFLFTIAVIAFSEYLRFYKWIDPSKIWFFREMWFALFMMLTSYVVFKKVSFGREKH